MVKLLDHWGRALHIKGLEREVVAPSIGGVRDVWSQTIVSGLTPAQLADILQQAARGHPEQFFQLADDMEERVCIIVLCLACVKMLSRGWSLA